jgi:hypothetical protein
MGLTRSLTAGGGTVTAADITDSTAAGRALLTAANASAQRTAIGAETAGAADALHTFLQGVELNPEKIGAELLPETVEFSSIKFENASTLILPNGEFTGGVDDKLYRHNNIDPGGLPYAPLPNNTVQKSGFYPFERLKNRIAYKSYAGNVNTDGTLNVTITSTLVAGSPLVVPVNVLAGDRTYAWLTKVVNTLNTNTAVNPHYLFSHCTGVLHMQQKVQSTDVAPEGTFSFSVANGTATGITAGTSSQSFQSITLKIGEISLPASQVNSSTKFLLTGSIGLEISTDSVGTIRLCFRGEGDGLGAGLQALHSTATTYELEVDPAGGVYSTINFCTPAKWRLFGSSLLTFTTDGSLTGTNTFAYPGIEKSRIAATNTASKIKKIAPKAITSEAKTEPNLPCILEIYVVVPISATATNAFVQYYTNLTLNKVESW